MASLMNSMISVSINVRMKQHCKPASQHRTLPMPIANWLGMINIACRARTSMFSVSSEWFSLRDMSQIASSHSAHLVVGFSFFSFFLYRLASLYFSLFTACMHNFNISLRIDWWRIVKLDHPFLYDGWLVKDATRYAHNGQPQTDSWISSVQFWLGLADRPCTCPWANWQWPHHTLNRIGSCLCFNGLLSPYCGCCCNCCCCCCRQWMRHWMRVHWGRHLIDANLTDAKESLPACLPQSIMQGH